MLSIVHFTSAGRLARFALVGSALALAVGCGSSGGPGGLDQEPSGSSSQKLLAGSTAFGFAFVRGGVVLGARSYNEHVVNAGQPTARSVYGTNTVMHTGVGTYTVTMSGLGSLGGGNAQVVAEGSNANRCRLLNWLPSGADESIAVQCNAPSGAAADTDFDVMFYVANGTWAGSQFTDAAYAYFSPSGTMPVGGYNYNSSTAGATPNTVVGIGTGVYDVTLPKVHYQNASVQVSTYGGSGAPYCKIDHWRASGADTIVTVRCFDTAGTPATSATNVGFSLSYATSGPTLGEQGGHGWVSGGGMPLSYAGVTGPYQGCSGSITMNPSGNGITVSGLSVWGAPYSSPTMAQVGFTTAYGGDSTYCKLSSLVTSSISVTANVQCYSPAGVVMPSAFTVMTTSNQPSGPC